MRKSLGIACIAAVLIAAGCATPHTGDEYREITARTKTASGAPLANLDVTIWLIDADERSEDRVPLEMEPRLTDGKGEAVWEFESLEAPYVCGYRVRSADGTELEYLPPNPTQRVSTSEGDVEIVL